MRTTINLPDDLMRAAKQEALDSSRTFTQVVEEALRTTLAARSRDGTQRVRVQLPTSAGAPRPGVDLDDSALLLELMESRCSSGER